MISVKEATIRITNLLGQTPSETISITQATNRVLAENVQTDRNQPPFDTSAMDGYAIKTQDAISNNILTVVGTIPAGAGIPDAEVGSNEAFRIYTGAPIPKGADRIIIQEDVKVLDSVIKINENFESNSFVRPLGSDFKQGFCINAPQILTPSLISLLAAMNAGEIKVRKRPIVAIIPTGDELVMPGSKVPNDKIVASNIFGLQSILENMGAIVRLLPIAKDNTNSLTTTLRLALHSDLIVTVGGASVGDYDLVKDSATSLGFELSFYKIAMRPGKPLFAGNKGSSVLIGLPGNPVSALVCGYIFLIPAIQYMMGLTKIGLPRKKALLAKALKRNGNREHFMRAVVDCAAGNASIRAQERQDSSLLKTFFESNALLIRPRFDKPRNAGEIVEYIEL